VKTSDLTSTLGVFSSYASGSASPYKGKGYFMQRTTADIFSGGIGLNDNFAYYFINMGANYVDKWTQIVITYGTGGLNFYQDGQLSSGGYGDFVHNTSNPLLIGTVQPGGTVGDWYWNGQIADVSYYTKTLTAAQIANHY